MTEPVLPPLVVPPEVGNQVVPEYPTVDDVVTTATFTAHVSAQNAKEAQQDDLIHTLQNELNSLKAEVLKEDFNPNLQPDPTFILPDTNFSLSLPQQLPKWTMIGTPSANNHFNFFRNQVNTASPLPRVPNATSRASFTLRVGDTVAQTNPLVVEQIRAVIPGRSYTFRTLMCRRDVTNPNVRVYVLNTATGSTVTDISINSFGLISNFEWRYWSLPFEAPESGQVTLGIANHGAGNVITMVYIAEAILLRHN